MHSQRNPAQAGIWRAPFIDKKGCASRGRFEPVQLDFHHHARMKQPAGMLLSLLCTQAPVLRDATIAVALPPKARQPQAVCYALDSNAVALANENPNIAAVITTPELAETVAASKGVVATPLPKGAFYEVHNALCRAGISPLHEESFIDPTAVIDPTVRIGRNVVIKAGVRIGAHAVIEDFTIIGEETLIGPHVVIGGRGLQDTIVDGRNVMVEFAGGVRIGQRCEILSAALIQRPYLCAYTEISDDAKLGPNASVGHDCHIGRATFVGSRALVAGHCRVGDHVWIGAGAIVSDGLTVGDHARVQLGSVVIRNVPANEAVSGNFALSHSQHLRIHTRLRHER